MKRFMTLLCGVALATASAAARADEAAVRTALRSYFEAFNKHDLKTVAAAWAEKATHVDRQTGARTEGRDAIQADIAAAFKAQPDAKLAGRVDRIRFIKPDVAQVEGQSGVGGADVSGEMSTFSAILVNVGGKWLIDSIEESPLAAPASPAAGLSELEWLVGRWIDDSDDAQVVTNVRWSANKAFLLRSFSVQTADGATRDGTQVIGWDPRAKEVRSWTFNSDGSFGDATWAKNEKGWSIKSSQTMSDGAAASGTYVLTRVDNDTLTMQLVGHEIDGEPQPAAAAVKMKRAAAEKTSSATQPPAASK